MYNGSMQPTDPSPMDYTHWLVGLKQHIQSAQQRATLSVNRELVLLYRQIGRDVLDRQQAQGWGAKVIEQLAKDLTAAFPDMKGFSRRNLLYMRSFAEEWPDLEFVQQVVALLPWGQNLLLLTKLKTREERQWYAARAIEHGWNRDVLELQVKSGMSALLARTYWLFEALGFKMATPVTRGILSQTSVAGKQWLLAEILSLDSVLLSRLSYFWRVSVWR